MTYRARPGGRICQDLSTIHPARSPLISSPDDYFSLITLQSFFFTALTVLLYDTPGWRMAYFLVVAAFLFGLAFPLSD